MLTDTPDTTIAVAEKTCNKCGRSKPVNDFPFRDRANNVRRTECSRCFADYQTEYRAGKRRQELKQYVTDLATDVTDPAHFGAVTRTEAVVTAMLTRFGGLERFADDWYQFMRLAIQAGKHHVVQRSFEALIRLVELTDRGKEGQENSPDQMTDEELDQSIANLMIKQLWKQPEIAAVIIEELGGSVELPAQPCAEEDLETVGENVRQRLPGPFS